MDDQLKEVFRSLRSKVMTHINPAPLSPEYPLNHIRSVQYQLHSSMQGTPLDQDPIFLRNYLIQTHKKHESSLEGYASFWVFYGMLSIIGTVPLSALLMDLSFTAGLGLLTLTAIPHLWLRKKCKYHIEAIR